MGGARVARRGGARGKLGGHVDPSPDAYSFSDLSISPEGELFELTPADPVAAATTWRGRRRAVNTRRGRRTTGLCVSPSDQAGADALLAAIGRVVPDEKRTLECWLPRIRREFDKTTGLALQAPLL